MKLLRIATLLNFFRGLVFLIGGIIAIYLVHYHLRELAFSEAKSKARLLLDHHLAIHHYFSFSLKPKLLESNEVNVPKDYFEPVWMSSTYAVREIDKIAQTLEEGDYYYKECAINARSEENEADKYERIFLNKLNANPELVEYSDIRQMDGKPFFVLLRRGEVMEQTCLRCHSSPEKAPRELVEFYGDEKSFGRNAGDVVSAISIRIPLADAYASANKFSLQLVGFLLVLLAILYWLFYMFYKRFLLVPLDSIRNKARLISENDQYLGEKIALPAGMELRELTQAFNRMSTHLRSNIDELEARVEERTDELTETNSQLHEKIEEHKLVQQEREKIIEDLQKALAEIKTLSGLLPICSNCKKIRDDKGYWNQLETYLRKHSDIEFTHGICPECSKKLYPDLQ